MTKLTFFAGSLPHFSSRLAPLWHSLPERFRGPYYARGRSLQVAIDAGVEVRHGVPKQSERELVVVASHEDYRAVRPARVIMVAHGAGQRYSDGKALHHQSYSGGKNRERVVLNITAGEYDASACREAGQEAVAAGPYHIERWLPRSSGALSRGLQAPTIAFSFHADHHVTQETRWSFPHYQEEIVRLIKECSFSYNFVGHCHPRMWSFMRTFWPRLKIPFLLNFSEVLDEADLYVCDSSSSMYEFAATGRPVLALNAPWYRKSVHHGLRFWDAVPGFQVDEPEDLLAGIKTALDDDADLQAIRQHAVQYVYSDKMGNLLTDGHGTERAVQALMDFLDE